MNKASKKKRTTAISGFHFIKKEGGISEYLFTKNGLQVLVLEDHSTPTGTVMVTYRVGSRHEAIGHTGATHLLEHLMFKGSKKFQKKSKNSIDQIFSRYGGILNATTWNDRTNYYETTPKEHMGEALEAEADRMRNATFTDKDRQDEMPIVRNEFERGENNPGNLLSDLVWSVAYRAHPYHHSTIGWRSDIENVSTARLREFYDTYYVPNNATVTVIGDMQERQMLTLVKKHFGKIPRSKHEIRDPYTEEPEQEGKRVVYIDRPGETNLLIIAHKIPGALHKDIPALAVLSSLLADGVSSRLYKKLVDGGLATGVHVAPSFFKDPGLLETSITLAKDVSFEAIEAILTEEFERLKTILVDKKELEKIKTMVRADVLMSRDGSHKVAGALNESIALGDWIFFVRITDIIDAVSREDVMRVAKTYLIDKHATTGYFRAVKEAKQEN